MPLPAGGKRPVAKIIEKLGLPNPQRSVFLEHFHPSWLTARAGEGGGLCSVHKFSVAVFSLLLGTSLANAADMPSVVVAPRVL
jgi:hypothetical protein